MYNFAEFGEMHFLNIFDSYSISEDHASTRMFNAYMGVVFVRNQKHFSNSIVLQVMSHTAYHQLAAIHRTYNLYVRERTVGWNSASC